MFLVACKETMKKNQPIKVSTIVCCVVYTFLRVNYNDDLITWLEDKLGPFSTTDNRVSNIVRALDLARAFASQSDYNQLHPNVTFSRAIKCLATGCTEQVEFENLSTYLSHCNSKMDDLSHKVIKKKLET